MQINILKMKFRTLKINPGFATGFSRARFHIQITKQVTNVYVRPLPYSINGISPWQRELGFYLSKVLIQCKLKPLKDRLFSATLSKHLSNCSLSLYLQGKHTSEKERRYPCWEDGKTEFPLTFALHCFLSVVAHSKLSSSPCFGNLKD